MPPSPPNAIEKSGEVLASLEGVTRGLQEILDYMEEKERKDQEKLEDFYRRRNAWKAEVKDRLKHLLPWEKGEKGPRGEWRKVKDVDGKEKVASEENGKGKTV